MKKNLTTEYFPCNRYCPRIDGLRAIAVLAVIFFHMDSLSIFKGGFTGVDIFFVISGYVISRSIYNRKEERLGQYFSEFYKKRLLRILPALLVCLIITFLLTTLFVPDAWLSKSIDKTGLSAFWGYSNFSLIWNNDGYFSPRVEYNPFLHTWSLGVEEQFYFLFPLIFYLYLKFGKNKSASGVISRLSLAILGIVSLIFVIFETQTNPKGAFYLLPGRFWELCCGALLFQLHSENMLILKSKITSNIFIIGGLVLVAAGFIYPVDVSFPFPWALVPVSGTVLILISIVSSESNTSFFHHFLTLKPVVYIGKISYSLYLWHWPLAVLLRWTTGFNSGWIMVIYLAAVFGLASGSYHFIENPLRKSGFLIKQKNWKIITGGLVLIGLIFSLANLIINNKDKSA